MISTIAWRKKNRNTTTLNNTYSILTSSCKITQRIACPNCYFVDSLWKYSYKCRQNLSKDEQQEQEKHQERKEERRKKKEIRIRESEKKTKKKKEKKQKNTHALIFLSQLAMHIMLLQHRPRMYHVQF